MRTRHNGHLYVFDGQTRVLNACYHNESWIDALVVDVDEQREVV